MSPKNKGAGPRRRGRAYNGVGLKMTGRRGVGLKMGNALNWGRGLGHRGGAKMAGMRGAGLNMGVALKMWGWG